MPSARFELCHCGCCSGVIILPDGFSSLKVCSKEEARISAEAVWFRCGVTVTELKDILRSIEQSHLPEKMLDVAELTRMEALAENLKALGRTNGPPFVWDEDLLIAHVTEMLTDDEFSIRDVELN